VLILPPGHAQTVAAKRRFSRRERWMIGTVLGTAAALIVAVVISLATASHSSGNGCVDVTIPYAFGGQEFYRCGAAARSMCASVGVPNGYSGTAGRAVALECRKAGLAIGR
jgi:hypothetical protein